MPNPLVQKYSLKGKFYLWSYLPERSNYNEGIHFTCSDEGGKSLLELLQIMRPVKWPARKSFALSEPSENQIRICGEKARTYTNLEIRYQEETPEKTFILEKQNRQVSLTLSTDYLDILIAAIEDILRGNGDYSIGEVSSFWIWWNLSSN